MITEIKLTPTVRNLLCYQAESFFGESISSSGILPSICEALRKYKFFYHLESYFHNSTFYTYSSWKTIAKNKINKYEENAWNEHALSSRNLHIARACLENLPPRMFWAIADTYPDLVARRHVQVRLMSNFGLNGRIPWLTEPMVLSVSLAEKITKQFVLSFLTVPPSRQILTHFGVTCFRKLPILMLPMELKYHISSPI